MPVPGGFMGLYAREQENHFCSYILIVSRISSQFLIYFVDVTVKKQNKNNLLHHLWRMPDNIFSLQLIILLIDLQSGCTLLQLQKPPTFTPH